MVVAQLKDKGEVTRGYDAGRYRTTQAEGIADGHKALSEAKSQEKQDVLLRVKTADAMKFFPRCACLAG